MTLVSVSEYAALVSLSEGTVRKLAREGYVPAVKVGPRVWRIDASAPLPRPVPSSLSGPHKTKGRIRNGQR